MPEPLWARGGSAGTVGGLGVGMPEILGRLGGGIPELLCALGGRPEFLWAGGRV